MFGVRLTFRFWILANVGFVGFQPMYDLFSQLRMSLLTLGFFSTRIF